MKKVRPDQESIPSRFRSSNPEEEAKINSAIRSCLSGSDGNMVMAYLRNVSFNTVHDPSLHTEKHLWMQEGAKMVVLLLQERMKEAK